LFVNINSPLLIDHSLPIDSELYTCHPLKVSPSKIEVHSFELLEQLINKMDRVNTDSL
jgi:hypothetical protein